MTKVISIFHFSVEKICNEIYNKKMNFFILFILSFIVLIILTIKVYMHINYRKFFVVNVNWRFINKKKMLIEELKQFSKHGKLKDFEGNGSVCF